MNRLGRRTAWLGWVVAGVLALSAGGVAFAANNSGDRATDTAPVRNLGLLFAQTQGSQGDSTQGKLPGLRPQLVEVHAVDADGLQAALEPREVVVLQPRLAGVDAQHLVDAVAEEEAA